MAASQVHAEYRSRATAVFFMTGQLGLFVYGADSGRGLVPGIRPFRLPRSALRRLQRLLHQAGCDDETWASSSLIDWAKARARRAAVPMCASASIKS